MESERGKASARRWIPDRCLARRQNAKGFRPVSSAS
jgi:hypothetical protein